MGDPMDLVSHVNRSKTGMTKMQVQLSIEMRAGMAEASKRLGMSQLSLIRSAISAFLQDHGAKTGGDIIADSRSLRGHGLGVASVSEQGPPVAEPVVEPEPLSESVIEPGQGPEPVIEPVTEPEPAPPSEPDQSTEPPTIVPEQTPAPKPSRRKKGGKS